MTTRNNKVRFCQNNMLAASGVSVTASGAKTNFPASNLYTTFRYQVWTPPGTFVITSANNQVPVNDGSNVAGSVTVGTYTYATLATAIATALNAVSSNWTSTYDFSGGSFKFTIGRSSGTKILRCSVSTNAIWQTIGYIGVIDQTAALADEQRNHTSEFLTIDLGVARSPLCFFLIGAADGLFPISSAATITLKANSINDFSTPPLSRTLSVEGTGIFHWLDDLSNTAYRYWKFEFADTKNTVGPEGFSLNVAYLGDYVTPTSFNLINGFTRTLNDPSILTPSQAGVPFFRKLQKFWTYDAMQVDYLSGADRTALEAMIASIGQTAQLFVAIDPTQAISASPGELTKYMFFSKPPVLTHILYNMFSFAFAAQEAI